MLPFRLRCVAGILACTALLPAGAQSSLQGQYVLDRWNTETGLPQNSVNAIMQSRDGHLWLGTYGGIARFDGIAFTSITTGDRTGLLSDRATSLAEDREGRIWIGTEAGLSRYHGGTITTFTTKHGLPHAVVGAVAAHPDGSIWFATSQGALGRVDSAGIRVLVPPLDIFGIAIYELLVDDEGVVWVSALTGTWRVDSLSAVPVRVMAFRRTHELRGPMTLDPHDGIWAATDSAIVHVAKSGRREYRIAQRFGFDVKDVRTMATSQRHVLWMGTRSGALWRVRVDSGVAEQVTGTDAWAMTHLTVDREGSVWIGNRISGLARVRRSLFQVYSTANGMAADNLTAILLDSRGRVWTSAKCEPVSVGEGWRFRALPRFALDCIWAFAEDTTGAIWMAGRGVGRWKNGRFEKLDPKSGWPGGGVRAVVRARNGTMWTGNADGLVSWDGKRVTPYAYPARIRGFLQMIHEARDGALWLGTQNGLMRFSNGEYELYTTVHGLPLNDVRFIHEDSSGTLWIGTYGGGLARLQGGKFHSYTTADGLFDNFVSSIVEDSAGYFWLSGNRGVFRIARRELEAHAAGHIHRVHSVAYGRADGMLSAETNGAFQPAVIRFPDGRLGYPTLVGLAIIDPSKAINSVAPVVSVERVVVNGRPREPRDGLSIGPGAADVEVAYTGVSLNAPNAVAFRYQLEGWDKEWIDAGTRRSAFYSRLAPGSYTFRVIAANRDGVWSAQSRSLAFTVRPYFWQTWWFRGLALLAIAAVPYARDRRQRRRQRELTRIVGEKTHELRQQKEEIEQQAKELEKQNEILAENVRLKDDVERISRHDLRTPLSSIISLAQIVREDPVLAAQHQASLKLIEQAGYRVMNMANLTLDLYKMEQGTYRLTPRAIDIHSVTQRVLLELQALLRTREVTCDVVVQGFGSQRPLVHGDELLSHSMLSNVVKNAIEASPRGASVTVRIVSGDPVRIQIHNHGVIPAGVRERFFEKYATAGKKGGTGLGAYSARLMAETQGGRIAVETSDEKGTTLTIELMPPVPTDLYESGTHDADGLATPLPPAMDSPRRRLLVVDDDENNRAILRHFLAHPRWIVDDAENGPLALRKIAESTYDFVFLDIEMPVMDGFEVVRLIRALHAHREGDVPRTVVVALSSHDDQPTQERALRAGFDRYFVKPVSRRTLVELVLGGGTTLDLDADISDLIPSFLTKKRAEIAQLADAVERGDGETVRRISHRLRGSFSLYGFTDAAGLCGDIEQMGRSNRLANARERVSALAVLLDRFDARDAAHTSMEA